jgi:hypothetical protein
MIKSAIVAAVFSFAFVAPALADAWKCDETNLNDMKAQVGKLDSKAAQEEGAKEWELAMTAMKGNNVDECNMRMTNVNKTLGGINLERAKETEGEKTTTQ